MRRIGEDDPFAFIAASDRERPDAARPVQPRRSPWRRLVAPIGLGLHALLLAAGLHFVGAIRIPHLEGFTRDRLLGAGAGATPTAPQATALPRVQAVVPPARTAPTPAAGARMSRVAAPPPMAPTPGLAVQPVPPRPAPPAALGEPPFGPDEARTVLASKHLSQQPEGFALDAEAAVRAKLGALRSAAVATRNARLRADEVNAIRERITWLNREAEDVGLRIAQMDLQMRQFAGRSHQGRVWHGNTVQEDAVYNQIAAEKIQLEGYRLNQVIPTRNTLRDQLAPGAVERANEASGRTEQAGREALDGLRDAVQKARDEFVAVAADPKAARALKVIGQPAIKVSREFLRAVEELGEFERTAGRSVTFARSSWPEAWLKAY